MTPDASDAELVARVLAGERDLFDALVERHGGPLFAAVRQRCANLEDAREVFQETWLRAFERLATVREPERLRAWLLSIGLNLVRQRGRRATPRQAAEERLEREPDGSPGAERDLERHEELEQLRAAVAALPPRQREVVELRLSNGLSHAEIAELLSIREDASRANYYQAVRRLRARLEDDGGSA